VRLSPCSNNVSKGLMISAPWGASVSPDAPFASLSLGSLGARLAARFVLM